MRHTQELTCGSDMNFHLGAIARGPGKGSSPRGFRGEVAQKLKQFADIVYRF